MKETWDLAFHIEPDLPYTPQLMERLPDIGVTWIGPTCFEAWRDDARVETLAKLWNRSGLKVRTYHSGVGLMFAEPGRETEALTDACRQVDIAAHWRGRTVVFHHDSFRDYPKGRDTYWLHSAQIAEIHVHYGLAECNRRFAEILAELASYAAARGIAVCVENIILPPHPDEFGQIIELLEQAGGDALGLCLDSSHAYESGFDVAREIRRTKKWLKETHFSDNLAHRLPSKKAFRDLHLAIGLGSIDWFDVCAALREIDYPGPLFFEVLEGIPGTGVTLESQLRAIETTVRNWRAIEFASAHLPPPAEG